MKFDDIVKSLGEFGTYQKRVYFLLCIACMSCGIQVMISVFTQAVPDHRCVGTDLSNYTQANISDEHTRIINYSVPYNDIDGNGLDVSQCSVRMLDKASGNITEQMCKKWVYDNSVFQTTVTSQFDLVCEHKMLRSHATMILMAGLLLGAIGTGVIADIIGRKLALMAMVALHVGTSIGVIFTESFIIYAILRFFTGVSVSGLFLAIFVLGMELVGPSKRMFVGIVVDVFWSLGVMLLGGIAFFIRDWYYLQMAVSLPAVLLFSYWWLIPESPRWLLARGRDADAEAIIRHAARVNGVTMPDKIFDGMTFDEAYRRESLWSIFTAPKFFMRLIILCYNWLASSMVFYGLSLNSGNLAGNIYINFQLMAIVEIIAFIICLAVLNRIGRKIVHIICMVVGGGACLSTIFIVLFASDSFQWINIVLALIGKCGASAAFAIVYIYSAELFPTVLRNSLMGVTCLFARLGGMISPYIADLSTVVSGPFGQVLPLVIFGASTIAGGLLCLLLPETLNKHLPETLEDAINFGKINNQIHYKQNEQDTEFHGDTSEKERKPLTLEETKCVDDVESEATFSGGVPRNEAKPLVCI